ncbi:uncharacterized protein METZ01_LOCUS117957, partial [marine metagenome]
LNFSINSSFRLRLAKSVAARFGGLVVCTFGQAAEKHWAFQPVSNPSIPITRIAWPSSPIDYFILRKLNVEKMSPSSTANPRELIRRASVELTGLPPTFAEVEAFRKAYAADAQQTISLLVDRLLASPEYGERWGRHWL